MKQWADNNQFNSFNPWKGLLYRASFEKIAQGEVPVPVQARIDPTLRCPLDCEWCNSAQYRRNGHELDTDYIIRILEFLSAWGVKAVVWAGGGEPTYHPAFAKLLQCNVELGMDAAVLSNGVIADPSIAENIGRLCRWAGISVDVGTSDTYTKLKGCATFEMVTKNIRLMAENSRKCSVGYKFLITPSNQHEIYKACQVAKDIGADDFVARPADINHQGMKNKPYKVGDFNVDDIVSQFEQCHGLEDDGFHVYTVVHKFNKDMSTSHPFSQCYGAPLRIQIATDGNVYFCDDQYYRKEYRLGSHYPDPVNILRFWGGEKHKQLLYGNTPKKCTTRCCVSNLCIQCERLFADDVDLMCINYP